MYKIQINYEINKQKNEYTVSKKLTIYIILQHFVQDRSLQISLYVVKESPLFLIKFIIL